MHTILTLNKISETGLKHLPQECYSVVNECGEPDGILLRSQSMHDFSLPGSLLAIARAGAGVNNIPIEKCSEAGIVVFNTPGANANAVKELVLAGLLLSSRKIIPGVNWVQSLTDESNVAAAVERGKNSFGGPELLGKKLGVIGLGAIGVLVANAANSLGMEVYGFDPFISVDSAWGLSRGVHKAPSVEAVFSSCDYVTIHVPLNAGTKNMFHADLIKKLKPGARFLNFSRGELVDSAAMKEAVVSGAVGYYVTDFPTEELIGVENIITIPHLGASTPESEENCAVMAVHQLKAYIEHGNIENSVNFPECSLHYTGKKRICAIHRNIPNTMANLTAAVGGKGLNIDNMINKSRGDYAYTIIDVDGDSGFDVEHELMAVEGVMRVRYL